MTSLSPPIQSILQLFSGPLSSVRFADIDAAGLASSAEEVEAAMVEVERQETKLAELRQNLAQRQEALLVLAQQALAYARVYAENDEPLLEELNRISLPRAAKPRKANAAKANGARDVVRAEASGDAAGNPPAGSDAAGSDAAGSDAADIDAEPGSEVQAEELGGESLASESSVTESTSATPRRAGRKARGSAPQRASN